MSSKRVLFLSRVDSRTQYDTAASMQTAMQKLNPTIDYHAAFLDDLVFSYDGNELRLEDPISNTDLRDYDGVFLLAWFQEKIHEDTAMAVAYYAQHYNIPVMNSEALHIRSRTKLSQYVLAALNGVSSTAFVFSINGQHLLAKSDLVAMPCIVKAVMASRGRDNYLIKSREELQTVLAAQLDKPFVLQDFVANDGDYRLIVMGNEVKLALHRQAVEGSHLNNTSQGGSANVVPVEDLDPVMLSEAVLMAKLLRREVTGVDMIIDLTTQKHYFLEANNMPQMSTGSAIDHKMAALNTYIESRIAHD
ncbi:MAG: rimK [Candidatus Saccharibacteria bacterium]|nr:rimK [Candidatus Saccharibacteria bacterium]